MSHGLLTFWTSGALGSRFSTAPPSSAQAVCLVGRCPIVLESQYTWVPQEASPVTSRPLFKVSDPATWCQPSASLHDLFNSGVSVATEDTISGKARRFISVYSHYLCQKSIGYECRDSLLGSHNCFYVRITLPQFL